MINDISNYIEKARKDWDVPGLSVAIVKDGKVFLSKGFGELELGSGNQVDENSLFAIASNSKAFISSALGVLVQEGKVEDDRTPDLRRCERIRWPRPIIEHESEDSILVWENERRGNYPACRVQHTRTTANHYCSH